jgi:hypothetical protein
MASVGAGFTDLIAQQVVGTGMGDIASVFGGGGDDDMLGGLSDVDAEGAADVADQAGSAGADAATDHATAVAGALEGADGMLNDSFGDQLDTLERGMDDLENQTDTPAAAAASSSSTAAPSGAATIGVAAAEGAIIGTAFVGRAPDEDGNKKRGSQPPHDRDGIMVEDEPAIEQEKKSRFGWIGNVGAALATAAKESIAGAVLGDDLGEMLVEKQEERAEERKEERNRSKSELNASQSDFNRSKTDMTGSNSELNKSKNGVMSVRPPR